MSQQTSYSNQPRGYPGQRVGFPGQHSANSFFNDLGMLPQIDDIAIVSLVAQSQIFTIPASPDDSVTYRITINGTNCDYAADASSTTAEVRDGLLAAINAAVGGAVTATTSGSDGILVTADVPGVAFTYVIDTATTADIVAGTAVANVGTGTTYTFTINGYTISYEVLVAKTAAQIRDAIIDAIRAEVALEGVVAANPSGLDVRVTSLIPGTAFTIVDTGDANISHSSVQANASQVTIPFGRAVVKRTGTGTKDQSARLPSTTGQKFYGVVERLHSDVSSDSAGDGVAPGRVGTAIKRGPVLVQVEHAVAYGDPVYFRHTAGAGEYVGEFRKDADTSDADLVAGAQFQSSTTGRGIAVVFLNNP